MPAWAGPVARGLFLAIPVLIVFVGALLVGRRDLRVDREQSVRLADRPWPAAAPDRRRIPRRLDRRRPARRRRRCGRSRLDPAASPDAIAWRRCGHAAGLAGRWRASAGARSAPRGDRSGDRPRRRRCPVRRLRQPPGRLPVRRPRHARGRDHLCQLREARVLRARRRDLPCRWARRRPPRDRGPSDPGLRRGRRRPGRSHVRHPRVRCVPPQPVPGCVRVDGAPVLRRRDDRAGWGWESSPQ